MRVKQRYGGATIEYALFLALMAGGLVLAADTVSYAMRSSFDDASLAIESGVALRHLPIEDLDTEVDVITSFFAPDTSAKVQVYQFASVATSLFCGALVWYGLYCRRLTPLLSAHDLTEALNESPPEFDHDERFEKRQQILRILSTDMPALLESRLEVRHVMSRRLLSVKPDSATDEIRALMDEHKLRHLLVIDDTGKLVGLVSDRDLKSRSGATARQLMTKDLITVEPHALVNPAITMIINKRISCLPVVSEGKALGVVTSTDLMMALQCSMQLLQKLASGVNPAATVSRRGMKIPSQPEKVQA